jgi:hypothetical protein
VLCQSDSLKFGLLISNGFEYLLSGDYWISFLPGLALLLLIVAINLIGDALRDILNPREGQAMTESKIKEQMTSLNPVLKIGQQITEVLRQHRGMSEAQTVAEAVRLWKRSAPRRQSHVSTNIR